MQGYETLEAKNGRQCLDVLAEEDAIDLVILDVMMPGTNGWEVLESMRDQPEMAGVPVMLLTAVSTEESKVKGFELGAADYLVKPFAIGELLARVQRILSEKQEREALAEFSITDWVTGLFNRRYLELRLGQEIARSLRYKSPLTGIFFDIDQLPEIHDRSGPILIDALLGQLAQLLRGQIRACDLVFRYDGDFFFLLLPDTDGVGAFEVAERIRRTVSTEQWAEGAMLSASIGVIELSQGETADRFMARAEEALGMARSLGGDATWSAFAQAGGRPYEPETPTVEPVSEYALPEVTVLEQPLPQVSVPSETYAPVPAESAPHDDALTPQTPQPAIPLPTAQTQVLNTGDLAALRSNIAASEGETSAAFEPVEAPVFESDAGDSNEAADPEQVQSAYQAETPVYTPQTAASGWGPQIQDAQPPAAFTPAPQAEMPVAAPPPPQIEIPAAVPPAPQAEVPGEPPAESNQQEPAAPGPSSWADAQMMAATQFTVPPSAPVEPDAAEVQQEQYPPAQPAHPPQQYPQQ